VLAHQPAAYWRLGESSGTFANDSSPHRRDATYEGQPLFGQPGAISRDPNTSVFFDGVTEDAVWNPAPGEVARGPFTVVAWIDNTGSTGSPEQTFFDTRTPTGECGFDFMLSAGNLKVDVGDGNEWFLNGLSIQGCDVIKTVPSDS
jgi:hypothetical protein